jgi:hypothetical protein
MKKLFLLALLLCLFAPSGITQLSDSQSTVRSGSLTADDGSLLTFSPTTNGGSGSRAPGSLTTIFASNNQFAGNTMDITPAVDLEITALDINAINAGATGTVRVYYKTGTSVGFESDPNAWTLLGVGTGTLAGQDLPSFIDLSGNGVVFLAGQLYGLYVHLDYVAGVTTLRYTNGGPNTYSNADLSLTTYNGKGDPIFTGSTFPNRIWNGTVYYNTGAAPPALTIDNKHIQTWVGGIVNFKLEADVANAGRYYVIFASVSGNSPGTPLPKGGPTLPINWDVATNTLLGISIPGFVGTLDSNGSSTAQLPVGPFDPPSDFTMTFAYALNGPPWDFASNYVEVFMEDFVPMTEYKYDDGSTENSLGLTAGGVMCWMNWFDAGTGDVIKSVSSAWGSLMFPNNANLENGPTDLYVWDDPNNDKNPADAVLVETKATTIIGVDTDVLQTVDLDNLAPVTNIFFIGCACDHPAGNHPGPMDQSTPYTVVASWLAGAIAGSGVPWDPKNLGGMDLLGEASSFGFPTYWLLRATPN